MISNLKPLIKKVLQDIGLYSDSAVDLLMLTCAQESHLGKYRRQIGGPALGIFQMEPNTFQDICVNYLQYRSELAKKIMNCAGIRQFDARDLVENDRLAICMARVHYLRVKESIPGDLQGWARYWKQYYNTVKGRGTEVEAISNYNRLVL